MYYNQGERNRLRIKAQSRNFQIYRNASTKDRRTRLYSLTFLVNNKHKIPYGLITLGLKSNPAKYDLIFNSKDNQYA